MRQKSSKAIKSKSMKRKGQSAYRRRKRQRQLSQKSVKNWFFSLKKAKTWTELLEKFVRWFKQKETWGVLLLLLLLLSFFVKFGTHKVDGQSMAPTFQTGDRIIIKKQQKIRRYDIVTFEPKQAKGESYVKRIIGIPGDYIQVEGTTLFLLPKENLTETMGGQLFINDLSSLADGTVTIQVSEYTAYTLGGYQTIPEGKYFVEGDNRLHSDDSRVFGLVEAAQIEGVVIYRYYPLTNMGTVH